MSIEEICKKYGISNYTINDDKSIDVDGHVIIWDMGLTELPLKFNKVNGDFECYDNKLTSLEGGPIKVSGNFDCGDNKLTDLKGSPKEVGGNFNCSNNELTSLEFGPEVIKNGTYSVRNNDLYDTYGLKTKGYHYIYLNNNPVSNVFINKHGFNEFDPRLVKYFNSAKVIEKKNNEYSVNIKRLQYLQTMFENKIDTIKIAKFYDINYLT
jgi:hypothetical protein